MTARFTHCRDPLWFGGSGFEPDPPLNPAAVTWLVSDNAPVPPYGWGVTAPAVEDDSGIYANGTVQVSGASFNVLRTTDQGKTWSAEIINDPTNSPQGVFLVNGRAVAFSANYCYGRSPSGAWSVLNPQGFPVANGLDVGQVAFGNGLVVCLPQTGSTEVWVSSDDCSTWAAYVLPADYPSAPPAGTRLLVFDGQLFVALLSAAVDYQLATSADGVNWGLIPFATPGLMICFDFAAGLYVICSTDQLWIADSIDGLAAAVPQSAVFAGATIWRCAVLDDQRIVLLLDTGAVYTSPDRGATWIADVVDWAAVGGFVESDSQVSRVMGSAAMVRSTVSARQLNSAYRQALC